MKLLTKTTFLYWAASLVGFAAAGLLVVELLSREMRHEVDEDLYLRYEAVQSYLDTAALGPAGRLPMVQLSRLPAGTVPNAELQWRDSTFTELPDADEPDEGPEYVPLRLLRWEQAVDGVPYRLTLDRMLMERDDALEAIVWAMVPVLLVLSAAMALLLRVAAQRLWRPFRQSLTTLTAFQPNDPLPPNFPTSTTQEFQQLNTILTQMTTRVRTDFQLQKAFSENAAHELQTPLAIAQAKLEALLQSGDMAQADQALAQQALSALHRMRRINQGLLTLHKIENRQFSETKPTALLPLVREQLAMVAELAALKGIAVTVKAEADPVIPLNPVLAELLLGNLLSNALAHNHPDGKLEVTLTPNRLVIANSGPAQALDTQLLFRRFQKQNAERQGTGLGLAIVKEICQAMHLRIEYVFQENLHNFILHLPVQN